MAQIDPATARKADAMMEAARTLATEYVREGKPRDAQLTLATVGALSLASLARLHDIIRAA